MSQMARTKEGLIAPEIMDEQEESIAETVYESEIDCIIVASSGSN